MFGYLTAVAERGPKPNWEAHIARVSRASTHRPNRRFVRQAYPLIALASPVCFRQLDPRQHDQPAVVDVEFGAPSVDGADGFLHRRCDGLGDLG